jgi:hypothetical protein
VQKFRVSRPILIRVLHRTFSVRVGFVAKVRHHQSVVECNGLLRLLPLDIGLPLTEEFCGERRKALGSFGA